MTGRRIAESGVAASCCFRTSTIAPERKALVQVTERCNLHCAHCFVSAGHEGTDISCDQMEDVVLPQLRDARVSRVTLTGGEPFAHPDLLMIVRAARRLEMTVTVCTNATLIEPEAVEGLERSAASSSTSASTGSPLQATESSGAHRPRSR